MAGPKKVPVYDILNCGPRHRFSANGKLVHNCAVQVHNLLRESAPLSVIETFKSRGVPALKLLGKPAHLLASMVRPAFLPSPWMKMFVADYAAIEARIVAWLAGEQSLLDAFRNGRDVYCEFGSQAFGRPITKEDTKYRYISKTCVLGMGFGGGPNALARGLKQGGIELPETELKRLVYLYRDTYPAIPALWYALRDVVLRALHHPNQIFNCSRTSWLFDGLHLWCKLPSGRLICYPYAEIGTDEYGEHVSYRRGNRRPALREKDWPRTVLWYGLITENLCQAIARDLLAETIRRIESNSYEWGRLVLHTHDETVVESKHDIGAELEKIMTEVPDWADGLPLAVECSVMDRYGK